MFYKITFIGTFLLNQIANGYSQELESYPNNDQMIVNLEGRKYSGKPGEQFKGNVYLNLIRSDDNDESLITFSRNSNQVLLGLPVSRWELGMIGNEEFGLFSFQSDQSPARTSGLTFRVQNTYASFGSPDYLAKVTILNERAGGQGLNVLSSGDGVYAESVGTGSQAGYGIHGKSLEKNGVFGESQKAHAIYGRLISSGTHGNGIAGVRGLATAKNNFGVSGYNVHGIAVYGESIDSIGILGKGIYGVFGSGGHGVRGIGTIGISGSGGITGVSAFSIFGNGLIASSYEGEYAGYFNGDVYTTGMYLPSDRSIKENIVPISNALGIIKNLYPKKYDYKSDTEFRIKSMSNRYGLLAQEVESVLPHLVKKSKVYQFNREGRISGSENKIKTVNYLELIPILIGGMKELQAQIDHLQFEIDKIRNLKIK